MAFQKLETSLSDCFRIIPQIFNDERGFFLETYSHSEFERLGLHTTFVQDNHSKSKKGVLRGLHFQKTHPQAKLVRVTSGSVYDVVVDLRKDSPTYGKWEGYLLSAENKHMVYIPHGFAHGFLTLEENTEFLYKCDDAYYPDDQSGILWNDSNLGIDWGKYMDTYGIDVLEIHEKDKHHPLLSEYQLSPYF